MRTRFLDRTLAIVLLALTGSCGELPSPGESGDVTATTTSALKNLNDYPAAAAVTVKLPSGTTKLWVFACDSQGRLRRITKSISWGSWQTLDSACTGVPTVGKWTNGSSDSVFVYTRRSDGHLWELYYPDAEGAGSWLNLSAAMGFGGVLDSPTIADSDGTGRVSVAAQSGSNLYTFDWYAGAWHVLPVLWGNGTMLTNRSYTNSNYDNDNGVPFLSGKAAPLSGDHEVAFVASRTSWSTNFVVGPGGQFDTFGVPGLGSGLAQGRLNPARPVVAVQISNGWFSVGDPTESTWNFSQLEGCVGPHGFTQNFRNPAAGATNFVYGGGGGILAVASHTPGGVGACGTFPEAGTVLSGVAPVIDGQIAIWPATSFGKLVLYKGGDGTLKAFNTQTRTVQGLSLVPGPP